MAFAVMFSTHPILSSDRSAGRIAEGVVIGITIAKDKFSARLTIFNYKKDKLQSFNGPSLPASTDSQDHSYPCSIAFPSGFLFP